MKKKSLIFVLFSFFVAINSIAQSTSVKPDLSSVSINYFDPSKIKNEDFKIMEDNTPFTIVDFSPVNELPATVKRATIYVLFSHPVVPISKLGYPATSSNIMRIEPEIKGKYRWYGTKLLAFEPDDDYIVQREYIVTISESVKSIGGKSLTGNRVFKFTTERLNITHFYPEGDDVPFFTAKNIIVGFNYPVNLEVIRKYIKIYSGGKEYSFNISRVDENYYRKSGDNFIQIKVDGTLFENTAVTFVLTKGARSEENNIGTLLDINYSFNTLKPFRYNRFDTENYLFYSRNTVDTNPVYIEFSHPLNENSVINNISVSLPVKNIKENIEVFNNIIKISNLPVKYNSTYQVILKKDIEDIYGRKLSKEEVINVEVPNAARTYNFPNYGTKILEAQFDPKIVFEYQNVYDGIWKIAKIDDPYKSFSSEELYPYDFSKLKPNTRHFEILDLKPYLNSNKYGFVGVSWNFSPLTIPESIEYSKFNDFLNSIKDEKKRKIVQESFYTNNNKKAFYISSDVRWNYKKFKEVVDIFKENKFPLERRNYEQVNLQVQVTDLGVTTRYAYNKILVWVNSLSTGLPVSQAKVVIKDQHNNKKLEGFTDNSGFVVFKLKENEYVNFFVGSNKNDKPRIYVEKGNDKIDFIPDDSHNSYHFGIYNMETPEEIIKEKSAIFLFTDRGLYKPGETVTYRGIDRKLILGEYTSYTGNYKIEVKDINQNKVIYSADGKATSSGGFYGSFLLPNNLEPGFYNISYSRGGYSESIDFQVANFRRLSFQVKVEKPKGVTYIKGDTISFKVMATYLSGGALSRAKCGYYWTREFTNFVPNGENWKSYSFGTKHYESSTPLNEGEGFLNQDGELICKVQADNSTLKGATYNYSLYAKVEDVDRQVIQGYASAIVHPASFYIGAKFSSGSDGWWSPFVKKGERVEAEIALVKPDGKLLEISKPKQVKIKLIRIDWKVAQQKGVYNRINTRYEQVEEIEKEELINTTTPITKFFVTTQKSGQYRLEFEAKDDKDRIAFTQFNFYSTGSDWFYWGSDGANDITMIPDRTIYKPSDTAKILVQSTLPEGSYLLTIEREGILEEKIINLKGSANVIDIPIKGKYTPIFYVALSSFSKRTEPPAKNYGEPDLGKPKGFFGIVPLYVSNEEKEVNIEVIASKGSYRPAEEAEFLIKAKKNGKPVANTEITFLAVDRGVIDLINYHVPNPLDFFYNSGRFPLAVFGADSRTLLMDPVTYEVKDLQGGSGEEESKLQKRKDFRPTAIFEPFLLTDKNGEVKVKVKLPDNLTTYRVTAIAVKDDNFGFNESEIIVQNPINVRLALPRKLRIRDTSFAGVVVTNVSEKDEDVSITIDSDILVVEGEKTKKIKSKANSSVEVVFKIAAIKGGIANISFTTISSVVNEKLESKITIEEPFIKEAFTTSGKINPEESKKNIAQEGFIIPSDIVENVGSLKITLDDTKITRLAEAIKYLYDYPYGCLEQRSSKLFPLVVFSDKIKNIFGFMNIVDPKWIVDRDLGLWAKFQNSDGGFPFWLENGYPSSYIVSVKVAKFLYYAKKNNFAIPQKLNIGALLNYIQKREKYYSDYEILYAYYVLTLHERNLYFLLEEYLKKKDTLSVSELALLTLSFWNLGKKDQAKDVFTRLKNLIKVGTNSIDIVGKDSDFYFDNEIAKLALVLMAFNKLEPSSDLVQKIVNTINNKQKKGYWGNTYSTELVLEAFYNVFQQDKLDETDFVAKVDLSSSNLITKDFKRKKDGLIKSFISFFTGPDFKDNSYSLEFPFNKEPLLKLKRDTLYPLNISMQGKGVLYYTITSTYALPSELIYPRDEGFSIFTEVKDTNGNVIQNPTELKVGETYKMRVIVSSSKNRNYVALRVPIPSGAEILDSSFVTTASYIDKEKKKDKNIDSYYWYDWYEPIQKIYDNEIVYMFDYFKNGKQEVEFLFRAINPGIYPTPPITAHCMYEEEVFGRTAGLLYYLVP